MFYLFNRSSTIDVDCFTCDGSVHKYTPVIYSHSAKPEWLSGVVKPQKENSIFDRYIIDKNNNIDYGHDDWTRRTISTCFGFLELYKRGFILENWCDLAIDSKPNSIHMNYSSGPTPMVIKDIQVSPGFENYHIIKYSSPWVIKTKENVNFINFGAEWSLDKYSFRILPGSVNFHYHTSTNVFLAVPKKEDRYVIPMGQQLCHFVPLTEKKIRIHNHLVTAEELNSLRYDLRCTSYGWRRTVKLVNRNDKRTSRCPFGFG